MNDDRPFPSVPSSSERRTSVLAGIVGIAGSFAFAGPTADFVVTPVNSAVVDLTPGVVVITAIQLLGTLSELLGFVVALLATVAMLSGAGILGSRAGRRTGEWFGVMLGVYFAGWIVAALLTKAPVPALAVAIPMGITAGVRERARRRDTDESTDTRRRRVVRTVASVLGAVGLGTVLGLRRISVETAPLSAISSSERATIERRLRTARRQSLDVDGIPGLVSSIDEFYEVDINTINPDVAVSEWSLAITGAVETEQTLTYRDLTKNDPEHRFATLRCVGDPLNGELMDTALWTGIPIRPFLNRAGTYGSHVMLRATDGYYEEFPIAALEDGFLAYGMNGRILPRNHGYPVRAHVPGHWGEINVKWITEIEVLDREARGYWEKRGWHGTGPVNTVAKLWAVNRLADGRLQVGGHAYAGTRGIQTVEVSTDGGESWNEATLSPELSGMDVWRQWKYEWHPSTGPTRVVVRAVDGLGNRQPQEESQPYPRGATGWVSKTVRP